MVPRIAAFRCRLMVTGSHDDSFGGFQVLGAKSVACTGRLVAVWDPNAAAILKLCPVVCGDDPNLDQ